MRAMGWGESPKLCPAHRNFPLPCFPPVVHPQNEQGGLPCPYYMPVWPLPLKPPSHCICWKGHSNHFHCAALAKFGVIIAAGFIYVYLVLPQNSNQMTHCGPAALEPWTDKHFPPSRGYVTRARKQNEIDPRGGPVTCELHQKQKQKIAGQTNSMNRQLACLDKRLDCYHS